MITNHWGITVDSEKPITGVAQNNHMGQGFYEELSDALDLDLEEYESENPENLSPEDMVDVLENWDSSYDTLLIGAWTKDHDGKYTPDQTGEYAAIVGEIYTQVVYSKSTKRCALCSPCYPGQGDLDSAGEYLTFDFPPDMYDSE